VQLEEGDLEARPDSSGERRADELQHHAARGTAPGKLANASLCISQPSKIKLAVGQVTLFKDILAEDGPARCESSIMHLSKTNNLIDIHPTLLAKAKSRMLQE